MAFSKEVVRIFFEQQGQTLLAEGGGKKGTLIFTGTLGAIRTNANSASHGASRSGARSLAQALAKEYSSTKPVFWFNSSKLPKRRVCSFKCIGEMKSLLLKLGWYTCHTCYCKWVNIPQFQTCHVWRLGFCHWSRSS